MPREKRGLNAVATSEHDAILAKRFEFDASGGFQGAKV